MDIKIETKDKIKYEACIAFSKEGYLGASMRNIAEKVGIKAATIYSHYESKEVLFLEVFGSCIENYNLAIYRNLEVTCGSAKEKLLDILISRVKFSNNYPHEFNFLMRNIFFPSKELKEELRKVLITKGNKSYIGIYREIYDELIEGNIITAEHTFDEFMAYFQRIFVGYIMQNKELNHFNTQESIEDVFNLHWEGLKVK